VDVADFLVVGLVQNPDFDLKGIESMALSTLDREVWKNV
jgi:hypothetical protein